MLSTEMSVIEGFTIESLQDELLKSFKGKKNKPAHGLMKKELSPRRSKVTKENLLLFKITTL